MSTILLVEDDPDIRHLVSYKLTKGGFDVVEVADGLAALRAARGTPPAPRSTSSSRSAPVTCRNGWRPRWPG
jgi:CheY-like chemotaxis protein